MTLSLESSNSACVTRRLLRRAASSAASLTRLARSAPEKPGVPRAITLGSTSGAIGTLRMCTRRIFSRPATSGLGTAICRSKRPGRSSAGSSTSGRLVAAIRMMPSFASKPSISTSSWLSVCSRSSLPPPSPAPRWRPTASISSMKMMQGAFFLACSNMSRTRDAPTPTNISTKSEPEMVKKGTLASPAMARASSVLPVPGGPTSSAPRGNAAAEPLELLRIAQELDDLLQVVLGLVDAGHVLEGDAPVALGQQLGLGLAEAHGAAAARLHLAHEEHPHGDQEQHREPVDQHAQDRGHVLVGQPGGNLHALLREPLDERGIFRGNGREAAGLVAERAADAVPGDGYFGDVAGLDPAQELGIADLVAAASLARIVEQIEKRHQQERDNDPDGKVPKVRIHQDSFLPRALSAAAAQAYRLCPADDRRAQARMLT